MPSARIMISPRARHDLVGAARHRRTRLPVGGDARAQVRAPRARARRCGRRRCGSSRGERRQPPRHDAPGHRLDLDLLAERGRALCEALHPHHAAACAAVSGGRFAARSAGSSSTRSTSTQSPRTQRSGRRRHRSGIATLLTLALTGPVRTRAFCRGPGPVRPMGARRVTLLVPRSAAAACPRRSACRQARRR